MPLVTRARPARSRQRGTIDRLPSGALRVRVHAGSDPITGRRHTLVEVIPPGPRAAALAEEARTRLLNQVDEKRHPRTNATVNQLLDRHFGLVGLERSTLATYQGYAGKHIRPLIGSVQVGALDADVFDAFYAELRRCRDHCVEKRYVEHRTRGTHECDHHCRPHVCRPLGASTIRQIHFILSGALKRAVRWRWISTNPSLQAEPPSPPKPNPQPPTAAEAARILAEAWMDPDWGTLVWLAMVTGVRRGELCGLRWRNVDLTTGVLALNRSIGQRNAETWEKDTKTHQHRRIALDPETVEILADHQRRCAERAGSVGLSLTRDAFVFSLAPDGSTYLRPNSVSERYSDLVEKLGIQTSLHKLRHYTATELITAGVDIRTVAGRLGHGGGGTTTLRVYAAWVSESDQRAATNISARLPARPATVALPDLDQDDGQPPYVRIAAALRSAIEDGRIGTGAKLSPAKEFADAYRVSASTAHRAIAALVREEYLRVEPGRRIVVIWQGDPPERREPRQSRPAVAEPPAPRALPSSAPDSAALQRVLLILEVRRHGKTRLPTHDRGRSDQRDRTSPAARRCRSTGRTP
jgi:integrase